jgi:hypothetical protein
MHRPHFRIKGGRRPTELNDLKSFEELISSPAPDDMFRAPASASAPSVEELRRMMHNEPEVRQVLLSELRQKLLRGDFLTREAAKESAGRLLDSGDLFRPIR